MSNEIVPESSLVIEIPETPRTQEPPKKKTARSKSKAKPEENTTTKPEPEPKPKPKPVRMQTKTVLNKSLYDDILRITKQYVSEMEQKLMELEH